MKSSFTLNQFIHSMAAPKSGPGIAKTDNQIVISSSEVTAIWRGYCGRGATEKDALDHLAQQLMVSIQRDLGGER